MLLTHLGDDMLERSDLEIETAVEGRTYEV